MNRNTISVAVGALFAAAAGSAFALDAATTAAVPAANQIRMSGATAQDVGILSILRRNCAAGSLDVFNYTGANAQAIYSCSLASAVTDGANTIAAGTSIVVFKDSAVGSDNGIAPFTTGGTGIQFANLSSLAGACTTSATVAASGSLIGYNNRTCGTSPSLAAAVTPDIGFSDVEPKIFGYAATEPANASVVTFNQMVFGVPVSYKLYTALQTAQGVGTARPSLSSGQIAGLFSGNLLSAGDLGVMSGTSPATDTVYIARRVATSGTQRQAEVNFLQQNLFDVPPTAFQLPNLSGATSTDTTKADYANLVAGCGVGATAPTMSGPVFAGNGSGDVRNCLNQHGNNRYAVGVLSLESKEDSAANKWKWVKIDGAAPTNANVIKGLYHDWVEQAALLGTAASANAQAFFGQMKSDLANPAYIASLNSSFTTFTDEPAGQQMAGIIALPESLTGTGTGACKAKFAGAVTADTDPVNIFTKSAGGAPNSAVKPGVAICPPRF